MSPPVENNRAEYFSNEDPPTSDSPNLSTSSSKTSSPIPGSPDQILQSQLLPTNLHDRRHDSDHPRDHHSDRGFLKEILNNRFVICCALFASLGGILFGYDVSSSRNLFIHPDLAFERLKETFSGGGDSIDLLLARSNFSDAGYGSFQFPISSNRPACFGRQIGQFLERFPRR